MGRVEKTVFISYRRASSAVWALAISQNLTHHGYDVFFDYQGIASGDFEQVILENIRARAHFLVLLTPSALDRIDQPGDWLRREIETALDNRRNMVPLMLEGFDFASPSIGKHLTGTLVALKSYNGLTVPVEYFDAAMERLMTKHLNVAVDEVLHPASLLSLQAAREQQAAAQAAPAVPEQELTAERWLERGFEVADLETQLAFYTEAIRLKPDFAEAFNNRSVARASKGDVDGALDDIVEALRLRPHDGNFLYNRGKIRYIQGDLDGAFDDFAEANRLRPEDAATLTFLGIIREARKDMDGALSEYNEAIRLKPDYATAYINRADTRVAKGDLNGALDDYNEGIRLEPGNAAGYTSRGVVRRMIGDSNGALADYNEAIQLEPDSMTAHFNRGLLLQSEGDLDGAVTDYQKYLDLGGGKRDGDQVDVENRIRVLQNMKP